MKKTEQNKWRKLDNTAHVFPVIANRNITNVYRIACVLKEDIDKVILNRAVKYASAKVEAYNVKLRKGFFWYYLEKTDIAPQIKEESDYPCKYIDPNDEEELLYRVTYYKKRINLEISHILTDGTGAMNFLKEIVKKYIYLVNEKDNKEEEYESGDQTKFVVEDSYEKNFKKQKNKGYRDGNAYKLKGAYLPLGMMRVTHATMNIQSLKQTAKASNSTISEYLVASLIWTIYRENRLNPLVLNPIKVCVPVNLRTYFDSETTLNFFSFIPIGLDQKYKKYTFDEILLLVKQQFKRELSKEKMQEKIAFNVSKQKILFLRILPLIVKKYGIKAVYARSLKSYTVTLSNLGIVKINDYVDKNIDKYEFIFEPTITDPLKLGVVSKGDKLVMSMSSILVNPVLERSFIRHLAANGIKIEIESNGAKNEEM